MKSIRIITVTISVLFKLALAIPSSPQYEQTGDEVFLRINNLFTHVDVPHGGWGKTPFMPWVVESAHILEAEKDVKCFFWGRRESRNSWNEETNIDSVNDYTYISSFLKNSEPYDPEAQDLSVPLPYSEVFCYDVSPSRTPNLAVLLLERPYISTKDNANTIPDSYSGHREGEGELILMSLDSSGEVIHRLDHESGQIKNVMKSTLVDVSDPNVSCSVVGENGEELVSFLGELSERRLIRDATHIHCKPREREKINDEANGNGDA